VFKVLVGYPKFAGISEGPIESADTATEYCRVTVKKTATVYELKLAILDQIYLRDLKSGRCFPNRAKPNQLYLIHRGKTLDENTTLAEWGVATFDDEPVLVKILVLVIA